jgi:hypothetical protein
MTHGTWPAAVDVDVGILTQMKKTIGYFLLVFSFVAWGGIAVLAWTDLSIAMMAAWTTGLVIAGEVAFFSSLVFLGPDFLLKVKAFFRKHIKRE